MVGTRAVLPPHRRPRMFALPAPSVTTTDVGAAYAAATIARRYARTASA
jgi:hypothetical protein